MQHALQPIWHLMPILSWLPLKRHGFDTATLQRCYVCGKPTRCHLPFLQLSAQTLAFLGCLSSVAGQSFDCLSLSRGQQKKTSFYAVAGVAAAAPFRSIFTCNIAQFAMPPSVDATGSSPVSPEKPFQFFQMFSKRAKLKQELCEHVDIDVDIEYRISNCPTVRSSAK